MSGDWERLARDCRLTVDDKNRIEVTCGEGRSHRVRVDESPDFIHIWSVVLTRGALEASEVSDIVFWEQNRYREIIGFKVDSRNRLIGEAWLPKIGAGREEFKFVVELVAKASDQMEYLLTGKDVE